MAGSFNGLKGTESKYRRAGLYRLAEGLEWPEGIYIDEMKVQGVFMDKLKLRKPM